jgi:membrane protein
MNAILVRLKRIFLFKFVFDVFDRFGKNNGALLAAGLAFFLVLAFVPLLLVGLWALGLVYENKPDEAVQQIQHLLQTQVLPGAAGEEVNRLMQSAAISDDHGHAGPTLLHILQGHGVAGIVGFLGIVWAAIQIFINGSTAMNAAWETTEQRNWFHLRGVALALLVGVGVLLVLSLAVTAISTAISGSSFAKQVPFEGAIIAGLVELGAVIVSALMYAVTYKFLPSPSAHISWKSALIGGCTAAIAFEVVKKGLSVYLLKPNKSLYGELGNLIAFVLWVYYSMMILLLGAEVSAVYVTEVEGKAVARLKRVSHTKPADESVSSSGSPLARSKEKNRAQRIRKTGQKEEDHAGRQ